MTRLQLIKHGIPFHTAFSLVPHEEFELDESWLLTFAIGFGMIDGRSYDWKARRISGSQAHGTGSSQAGRPLRGATSPSTRGPLRPLRRRGRSRPCPAPLRPTGGGLIAGGLPADPLAGLLPPSAGGSCRPGRPDSGPDLSSMLAGLLDLPTSGSGTSARHTSGWLPRSGAPSGRGDGRGDRVRPPPDRATGQDRRSEQPPDVFLDHRLLERLVLNFVDGASSGPATSAQRPDPRMRMPPGTAFAAS